MSEADSNHSAAPPMPDPLGPQAAVGSWSARPILQQVISVLRRPEVLGAVVGILGFLRYQPIAIVKPTNVERWLAGDWGTHMMGWLQFRRSPMLTFPLGQVPRLGYPLGTSLIFTDSIPLVALVLRPFSSLLPTDFQYLGLYLLASYVLQGVYGARITAIYLSSTIGQLAGAALFVLMPAFLLRDIHPALTAHWIILAVIYATLRGPRRRRWALASLVCLTVLIQPYIWLFVILLFVGLVLDDARAGSTSWRGASQTIAATVLGSIAAFTVVGAFSSDYQKAGGAPVFGINVANVLGFIAGGDGSRFMAYVTPSAHRDGYAYLGMGVLLLVVAAATLVVARYAEFATRRELNWLRRHALVLVAAILLLAFAFSDHVWVGSHEILRVSWLYDPFRSVIERFRSSSRAIWVFMYLIGALAIGVVSRTLASSRRGQRVATFVLVLAALVQVVDLRAYDRHESVELFFFGGAGVEFSAPLDDRRWSDLEGSDYEHLQLVPTSLYGCGGTPLTVGYDGALVARLSLQAYRADLTFNSGYFSRQRVNVSENCVSADQAATDELRSDTVYVFADGYEPPAESNCGMVDGLRVCVAPENEDRFAVSL